MSNAIASKGISLASIFDPYVAGTTKARASGIDDGGTDTSNLYANIIYGSAAAATGIQSENADLNTLYAAKGTANYTLPWNGQRFTAITNNQTGGNRASVSILFNKPANNYTIQILAQGITTTYVYPYPNGATEFYIKWTLQSTTGNGGIETNNAGSWVNLSGIASGAVMFSVSTGAVTGDSTNSMTGTMEMFFGANGAILYNGTATIEASSSPA